MKPSYQVIIDTIESTDNNLLLTYYLTGGKNVEFTDEDKEFMKGKKTQFIIMKKGLDEGVPIIFCINTTR